MNTDHRQKLTRYALGLTAWALALYFLLTHSREPVVFFASLFFLVICATDTLRSKIPNLATLSLLLIGVGYHLRANGIQGGGLALAGIFTGLALLIVPYLLGGMGAGDLKALAALGALLGPIDIFQVFLFTGIIGGAMALLHLAMSGNPLERLISWRETIRRLLYRDLPPRTEASRNPTRIKYSYGPAIAFGFFAFVSWGGLL
jgi:prepilin peptidase CpaA